MGRLRRVIADASLLVTAWEDMQWVGVARTLTDFNRRCCLSDLAVDRAYQSQGMALSHKY